MLLDMERWNKNMMPEDLKEDLKNAEPMTPAKFREIGLRPKYIDGMSFDKGNFPILEGENHVFIELENNGIGFCILQVMKKPN